MQLRQRPAALYDRGFSLKSSAGAMSLSPRPHHTGFDSSPLVRTLASLGGVDSAPSPHTAAERLSQWLDWTDAIALSAALTDDKSPMPGPAQLPAAARLAAAAIDQARRVRSELERLIDEDTTFTVPPVDENSCRASYRAHQHTMAARIDGVRAALRAALAARGTEGTQIAALDAVLARALAAREREWLGTVPALLKRHVAHQHQHLAEAITPVAPAAPGGPWLAALRAELATRWQAVEGLIDSIGPLPVPAPAPAPAQ